MSAQGCFTACPEAKYCAALAPTHKTIGHEYELKLTGDQDMVYSESSTQLCNFGVHTDYKSTPELLSHMPNSPLGRIRGKVLIQKCGILFNKFLRIV